MAGLRDLDSGKIYIGPVEPKKLDKSIDTKNGDKPYDGTLAVTGPAFIGGHMVRCRIGRCSDKPTFVRLP